MTDQRNDIRNDSSHKGTIVPTFTLDEYEDVKRRAYIAGLNAAREAVAAVGVRKDTSHDMRVQALAAIDALRGES